MSQVPDFLADAHSSDASWYEHLHISIAIHLCGFRKQLVCVTSQRIIQTLQPIMGKTKQIKAEQIAAAPKQQIIILAQYKPLPRFNGGCTNCN